MKSLSQVRPLVLACAFGLAGLTGTGLAQTSAAPVSDQEDHAAHHPQPNPDAGATAPQAPTPPREQSTGMPKGMMGQGAQGGMMGSDMQQMKSMMRNMMTMMSAQSGMMSPDVEGRIASLKSELKITDAQSPQWVRFADSLRTVAKSMNDMHGQMMQSGAERTLPARLERQEKMLAAHLSSVQALKGALAPLYDSLSSEQRKIADGLTIGPMGMM